MGQHFIGNVDPFHGPPESELPMVDIPAFSQSILAPESLLMQIDNSDLSDRSKERLKPFFAQDFHMRVTVADPFAAQLSRCRGLYRTLAPDERMSRWRFFVPVLLLG
jgi:hypothetical protein